MRASSLVYSVAGVSVLALLVYAVNPSKLLAKLAEIPPFSIAAFISSGIIFHLLRSIRWRMILGAIQSAPSLKTVFWTNMIGYVVNAFMPVRFGGEVTRAYILDSKERVGLFPSLASVAVDRILDLLAIVGLALSATFGYAPALGKTSFIAILFIAASLTLATFGVVLVGSRNLSLGMRGLSWLLGKVPMKSLWRVKILETVQSSLVGATAIGRNYKLLVVCLLLSVLTWAVSFVGFYALFAGVGISGPVAGLLLGMMLFQLASILPGTPGNVGTFEGFLVLVFSGLGLSHVDSTLAIGVVSHVLNLLIIGLLGIAGVAFLDLKMKEVLRLPWAGRTQTS